MRFPDDDAEPNWDQCTVCTKYHFTCSPPTEGGECEFREIDPVAFKVLTGRKHEPPPEWYKSSQPDDMGNGEDDE